MEILVCFVLQSDVQRSFRHKNVLKRVFSLDSLANKGTHGLWK
uniref:Uncharacterized protein n=1 Tax=uncultured Armatimonadetes bacterium TaxID=157466 RepID=A0A6J4J4I8_9BACT|nr:hypothetical protein AVDCRST_MAG63-2715 [uncultured Armatimonadetes bacterium]